jgi:hypothetical protein
MHACTHRHKHAHTHTHTHTHTCARTRAARCEASDFQILPVQVENSFGGVGGGGRAGGGAAAGEGGRGGSAPGPAAPGKGWSDIEDIGQGLLESIGLGWRGGEGAKDFWGARGDLADTHPPAAGSSWRDAGTDAGRGNLRRGGGGGGRDDETLLVTGVLGTDFHGTDFHGGIPTPPARASDTRGFGGGGEGGGSRGEGGSWDGGGGGGGAGGGGEGPGVMWRTEEQKVSREAAQVSGRDGWVPVRWRGKNSLESSVLL